MFYNKSWSFIYGQSQISIKSGSGKKHNDIKSKPLKKEDIIEVLFDRKLGQ